MERTDCSHCSHFFITWDVGAPYGCSAWGIKFPQHPQNAVYASSGIECQLFKPKSERTPLWKEHKKSVEMGRQL
jgi:hypothetical protein